VSPRQAQQSSSTESVRAWIEQQIRDGVFAPGDRLDEQEICARFGISRTPFREALLQLSMLRLVTIKPRQGAVVARLSVREIIAMWEVLTCLEGFCAGLATRRIDRAEMDELRAVHENARTFARDEDLIGYANANQTFHDAIYAASKNDYLRAEVVSIRARLQAYRRLPFSRPGGIQRSFLGHEAVMTALMAGDSDAAAQAMHKHVASAISFVDMVAELPEEVLTWSPMSV
jgi:DNA-binding GntR family transcriptional regulator